MATLKKKKLTPEQLDDRRWQAVQDLGKANQVIGDLAGFILLANTAFDRRHDKALASQLEQAWSAVQNYLYPKTPEKRLR